MPRIWKNTTVYIFSVGGITNRFMDWAYGSSVRLFNCIIRVISCISGLLNSGFRAKKLNHQHWHRPIEYFQSDRKRFNKKQGPLGPILRIFRSSRKLRYEKQYFLKMIPWFSCIFRGSLVIVRRVTGPDFYEMFEVPRIIQKVLEYDRGR